MRLKISAVADKACEFPFNYNGILNASLLFLISKVLAHPDQASGNEYLDSESESARKEKLRKCLKMFTFSRLNFSPRIQSDTGFKGVEKIDFIFSAPVDLSCQPHLIESLRERHFFIMLEDHKHWFTINSMKLLNDPTFTAETEFICLSPLTVGVGNQPKVNLNHYSHCLDYMNEPERSLFVRNMHKNLKRKYEYLYHKPYESDLPFEFQFNPDYIEKHNGRISKLIHIKDRVKIKGFEAPFKITADPALIEVGYHCGFGEKNTLGFGCAALLNNF